MKSKILELASLILDFGKVDRKTSHQDGVYPESDTDHTVMLGILAPSIAERLYPDLDRGLLVQFALIHDLVEVHTGDTPTLIGVSDAFFADKEARESDSLKRIEEIFGSAFPWVHTTIERYERLDTKEARFIKTLDKILPKLTVILNQGVGLKRHGRITKDEVEKTFAIQKKKLEGIAHDMPELLELWQHFMDEELKFLE